MSPTVTTPAGTLNVIMTAHPDCPECLATAEQITDPTGGIGDTTTDGTRHYVAAHHPDTVVVFGKSVGCVQCNRLKLKLDPSPVPTLTIDVLDYEAGVDVIRAHGFQAVPFVITPVGNWSGYRLDVIPALIQAYSQDSVAA